MLVNSLSSLRVSVPHDTRDNSVLSDYGIVLWAIKTVLKYLATPNHDKVNDDWSTRIVVKSPEMVYYSLTQRSIDELALCKPLSNEVLDSYIHLLVSQRCFSPVQNED